MSEEYITKDYTKENGGGATELINDLVDGKVDGKNLDVEDFSGLSLDGFARRTSEMWQWLLQHMHNTHTISSENGRYGIREEDFPNDILSDDTKLTSVVEFINENSDLSDQLLTKYIKEVVMNKEATINDKYWNESVAQLIDYFYHQFQDDNGTIDHSNITIGDVKNADAGNNFTDTNKLINVAKWVIPWQNISKETYSEVRGNDKIIRVIKDAVKLQFTKKKYNNPSGIKEEDYKVEPRSIIIDGETVNVYDYLRLLMPEYPRIVEIEDLDRNFWVIGQVLTALCAFLFDDDGPLKNMFDGILDEICQLWENVFYLWLSAIAETKENYTTIQGVFLPVTPYENYPYLKYDNFYRTDLIVGGIKEDYSTEDSKKILEGYYKQYLSYFKDLYKGTAICVVPEIRQINYAENYYAKATYLGFIVYDESVEGENKVQYNVFSYPIIIDLTYKDLGGYSTAEGMVEIQDVGYYSLRETETQYTIARRIADQISDGATPYIKLVQPQFNITLNKQSNGIWKGETNEEIFHFYDKVSDIYETSAGVKKERNLSYKVSNIEQKNQDTYYTYTLAPNNTFGSEESHIAASGNGVQTIDKKNGFYRGELISWYNIKYLNLKNKNFILMPTNIYQMVGEENDVYSLMHTTNPFDENHNLTDSEINQQDLDFINALVNNYEAGQIAENEFTLVTLFRNQGLPKAMNQPYTYTYWDSKGTNLKKEVNTLRGYTGSSVSGSTCAYIICPKLKVALPFAKYPHSADRGSYEIHINYQDKWYSAKLAYLVDEGDGNWGYRLGAPAPDFAEFYIKKTDKGVKKDNWVIRYTIVYGYSLISYSAGTKNTSHSNYQDDYDRIYKNKTEEEIKNIVDNIGNTIKEYDGIQNKRGERQLSIGTHIVSTLFFADGTMQQFNIKRKNIDKTALDENILTDHEQYLYKNENSTNMFSYDTNEQQAYWNVDPDNPDGINAGKYKRLEEPIVRYHNWPRIGTSEAIKGISAGKEQHIFFEEEAN